MIGRDSYIVKGRERERERDKKREKVMEREMKRDGERGAGSERDGMREIDRKTDLLIDRQTGMSVTRQNLGLSFLPSSTMGCMQLNPLR